MHVRPCSLLCALLAVGAARGQAADPAAWAATLQRHLGAVGSEVPPVLRITGTWEDGKNIIPMVTYVRAEPYAFRSETRPPGASPSVVISDGRSAWDDAGRLLDPGTARPVLEIAFVEGLLYRRSGIAGGPADATAWQLRDHEHLPVDFPRNLRTHWVTMRSPAGTLMHFHFDANDGLLVEVGLDEPSLPAAWLRFRDWQQCGPIKLPMRRASGMHRGQGAVSYQIEKVEFPASLPDELFAGNPRRPLGLRVDAGRLLTVPLGVPGSAAFLAPDIELNDSGVAIGIADTGATSTAVTPPLAETLGLPRHSVKRFHSLTTVMESPIGWLHQLVLGERLEPQLQVIVMRLPYASALPPDRQPAVLLGNDVLFAGSPVFDVGGRRLWLRGEPVTPLASDARGPVLQVPLFRGCGTVHVDVRVGERTVRALLDTGMPFVLRLDTRALQQLGLPHTPVEWTRGGALPLDVTEAGGKSTGGFVAELPALELGSSPVLRFLRPCVMFAEAHPGSDPVNAAIVGAGALACFARAGIDLERLLLELEVAGGAEASDGGAVTIAPAGRYAGCAVRAPPSAAAGGRLSLPRLVDVASGGAVHRAGLRDGEWLLRVNGQSAVAIGHDELQRLFWLREGHVLDLEVIGVDGRRRRVRVP